MTNMLRNWSKATVGGLAVAMLGLSVPAVSEARDAVAAAKPGLAPPAFADRAAVAAEYGKLPLRFEANVGQVDAEARFVARAKGGTVFLTDGEAVLSVGSKLMGPSREPLGDAVVRMRPLGANPAAHPEGVDVLPGVSNYLMGSDPAGWHTGVTSYAGVRYPGVYPGIDQVFHGHNSALEYDFVVAAGADPSIIALGFHGSTSMTVDAETGDLVLDTRAGQVRQAKPVIYQDLHGVRRSVDGAFVIDGDRVRFAIGSYDRTMPLVIDPVIAYSALFGGSADDEVAGIDVDASGAAYVAGTTPSTDFPTRNPVQAAIAGASDQQDMFITKLTPDGSALVYSTYLGGSQPDRAAGIAVDPAGSAYVLGSANSADFPMAGNSFDIVPKQLVVAKLTPDGSALAYSTFLGGTSFADEAGGISVDSQGRAYVTGTTSSVDFPTTSGSVSGTRTGFDRFCGTGVDPVSGLPDGTCNDNTRTDAFLAKINTAAASGPASLVYSTYLGGSFDDRGNAVAVDPNEASGGVYVTGDTGGPGFPTTSTAFQQTCARQLDPAALCPSGTDAFVVKLLTGFSGATSLTSGGFGTYLGSRGGDTGLGVAADLSGVYVTGRTNAPGFPTRNAFQVEQKGTNNDAFVTKLVRDGTNVVYSTFLGGSASDGASGIAVDTTGAAYVSGSTSSTDFPTKDSIQGVASGFLTKVGPSGSVLDYSTYLSVQSSVATNPAGGAAAYVAGSVSSADFPAVAGSLISGPGGGNDVAVVKVVAGDTPVVAGLVPRGGPLTGGTPVVITGEKFSGATVVTFGGIPAASFTVDSPTQITAVSPSHADGTIADLTVFVAVTTPQATSLPSGAARYVYGEGVFHPTGACVAAKCPSGGAAVTLHDGRVLYTNGTANVALPAASQLFNPRTGTWAATGACPGCGFGLGGHAFTITVLPDGKVLVAGGVNAGGVTAGAFLYDPTAGTWAATGSMTQPRSGHTATLLPGGKVLVAGGCTGAFCPGGIAPVGTAELFDPATGLWTSTGTMTVARQEHTATLLDAASPCGSVCGMVLVAFGTGTSQAASPTAELFDPATGAWRATGSSLTAGRTKHSAVRLLNGRVLTAAGRDSGSFGNNLFSAEVYNPMNETWSPTGNLHFARTSRPPMVRLPNGKVLITAGSDIAEIWNPADGEWRSATSTISPVRVVPVAALLLGGPASTCGTNCGKVLIAGGFQGSFSVPLSSAELYTPQPSVSGVSPGTGPVGTSVTITGTGLTTVSSVNFGSVSTTAVTHDPLNPDGVLTVAVPAGASGVVDVTVSSPGGVSPVVPAGRFTVRAAFSTFVAVSPSRILDTRTGNGAPSARVGAGQSVAVQVIGRGGVPASGVTAVAINVTAVAPTAGTFVTVWPTGEPRPTASNLNLDGGTVVPNLAVVKVGTGGTVSLFNSAGTIDLVGDVAGYYLDPAAAAPGSSFAAVSPARILDTRFGLGAPAARVGAGQTVDVQIAGQGGIPASEVTAVAVNVTAVNPSASSFVTAWPTGEGRPTASNLNLAAGVTRPNMVIVKVGAGGKVSLYNEAGTVDLLADVAGYYLGPASGTSASTFSAVSPARILDTRIGLGAPAVRVGPGQAVEVQVTGQGGVPASGVTSVVMNVTAVAPSAASFVTAWPTGEARPTASNLNLSPGVTVANLVVVKVGAGGKVTLYNDAGTTDLLADVSGYNAT